MKQFILLMSILLLASCHQENKSKFSLSGTTNGLENGTLLFLVDSYSNSIIDSVKIENNSFNFKTDLPFSPFLAELKNKDNSLYKKLWLENESMTFKASNEDFTNAIVTGSLTETKYVNLYKGIDTLSRKEGEISFMAFVKANSDNVLGAYVLSEWYVSWKKEQTEQLFNLFSEKNKNSLYGKEVQKYIELSQNPEIGEKYMDFESTGPDGQKVKLSDVKGRLTLLEFWASWCAPCRKDNKKLVTYYNEYKDLGFEIFQVSLDDNKEDWLRALKHDNLTWKNVSDLKLWKSNAAMIYGVNLLPTNYLIDQDGTIIGEDLRGKELEQKLKEILQ